MYYISILVEDGKELPVKQMLFESTTIGVNIGIRDFVLFQLKKRLKILSTRKTLWRGLKYSKKISGKQKSYKNREKAKQKLAVLNEKITIQRNDFQHKLSFKLVSENQAIAIETLNVKGMIKNHHPAQSIGD